MPKSNAIKVYGLVLVLLVGPNFSHAGSVGGFGGATEITQILNNSELMMVSAQSYEQVNLTIQEIRMVEQQLKNLINLPDMVWGTVQQDLRNLTSLVARGQALGYELGNIDNAFEQKFKGYSKALKSGYRTQSKNWTATSLDSLRAALETAGLQSQQFATEQAALNSIQNMAGSSQGALQAAQAGILVANQQVGQLQKLRQLFMAQMQAQNAVMAKAEQEDANAASTMEEHFQIYTPSTPSFSSRGGRH